MSLGGYLPSDSVDDLIFTLKIIFRTCFPNTGVHTFAIKYVYDTSGAFRTSLDSMSFSVNIQLLIQTHCFRILVFVQCICGYLV